MKKRTLAVVAIAGVLSVGAFAHGGDNDGDMMSGQQGMMGGQQMMKGQQGKMQNRQGMMGNQQGVMPRQRGMMGGQQGMMSGRQGMMGGRGNMMGRGMGMMGGMHMFAKLNLTNDQRFQLSILKDEMRLEMKKLMYGTKKHMGGFIKGDSFDKKAFQDTMNANHKKMLKLMSNNMAKAFSILNKSQIEQLKKSFAK